MLQHTGRMMKAEAGVFDAGSCSDARSARSLERERLRVSVLLMALDALSILTSFLLAGGIYLEEFPSSMAINNAVLIAPVFLLFGAHSGLYKAELVFSLKKAAYLTCYVFAISAFVTLFVMFYAKSSYEFSRVTFTLGSLISVCLILTLRWGARLVVGRKIGPTLQNTLIIQAGGPPAHIDHAYVVSADKHDLIPDVADPASLDRLGRYMENMDRVIISCPEDERGLWVPILRAAGVRGEFVSEALRRIGAIELHSTPEFASIVVSARPLDFGARVIKRLMDVSLSSVALIALSPVMAAVAIAIRMEDGGPALFKQRRIGTGNRFFWIYKFRSMRVESTDADAGRLTSREDDRTTRIGRFIRRTSLDELPQLYNVWRGDMSLVGPRPHALGALAGEKLYWEVDGQYWNRHVLKPGVTGLAQVRGFRGNTEDEQSLSDRLQADLEYISNWSVWLDLKILLQTLKVLIHDNAY